MCRETDSNLSYTQIVIIRRLVFDVIINFMKLQDVHMNSINEKSGKHTVVWTDKTAWTCDKSLFTRYLNNNKYLS